jgi:hypothetical protein
MAGTGASGCHTPPSATEPHSRPGRLDSFLAACARLLLETIWLAKPRKVVRLASCEYTAWQCWLRAGAANSAAAI